MNLCCLYTAICCDELMNLGDYDNVDNDDDDDDDGNDNDMRNSLKLIMFKCGMPLPKCQFF